MEHLRRLWGIVASPRSALASVVLEPAFAAPLLLLMAALTVRSVAVSDRLDVRDLIERQFRRSNPEALSSEIDRAVETATKGQRVLTYASGLVNAPLWTLGLALALFAATRFWGAKPAFKPTFASAAHVLVPSAVAALAAVPAALSRERIRPEEITTLVPSNVGAFLPETHGPLARALAAVDLFAGWQVVLFALALTALGVSARRAAITAGVLWLAWIAAVRVGMGGMGGGE